MKAQILKYIDELRSSYWFIPSLMAVGAIALAISSVAIDEHLRTDGSQELPFLYANRPEGARSLLATVAGSMIGVAGVTFSLTLLAVSHTTSQFGPRLLTNFMRDHGNQITLGTFIATFLYCLLILRTVRSAEEASTDTVASELGEAFVPHFSIAIALLLTLCSVAVLIYFFHHVPESMNLSNMVADAGRQLVNSVDQLFPEMIGHDAPEAGIPLFADEASFGPACTIDIGEKRDGYVQALDDEGLMQIACEHNLTIKLHLRPGDFIMRKQHVFSVFPVVGCSDEIVRQLQGCIALGVTPTPHQNQLFVVEQLVEAAARALSPGVNDPFTAIICMKWLGNYLAVLSERRNPDSRRFDEHATLRIIAPTTTFEHICNSVFDQLRSYFAADPNAVIAMMQIITQVRERTSDPDREEFLDNHADKLLSAARLAGLSENDVGRLRDARNMQAR